MSYVNLTCCIIQTAWLMTQSMEMIDNSYSVLHVLIGRKKKKRQGYEYTKFITEPIENKAPKSLKKKKKTTIIRVEPIRTNRMVIQSVQTIYGF